MNFSSNVKFLNAVFPSLTSRLEAYNGQSLGKMNQRIWKVPARRNINDDTDGWIDASCSLHTENREFKPCRCGLRRGEGQVHYSVIFKLSSNVKFLNAALADLIPKSHMRSYSDVQIFRTGRFREASTSA